MQLLFSGHRDPDKPIASLIANLHPPAHPAALHLEGIRLPHILVACLIATLTSLPLAPAQEPRTGRLYVFISASMSPESLVTIARDSVSLRAPLLLRGLVGSSLQETLLSLKDVAATGAALEVDPLPFEVYGIQAVPAVVLTCGARNAGPFALVYGLTASQALAHLRRVLTC